MSRLSAAVAELQALLRQGDALSRLRLEDGTVTFTVQPPGGEPARRVNVVYSDASAYPHTGALVYDEEGDEALNSLADSFEDSAPLREVVNKVQQGGIRKLHTCNCAGARAECRSI